MAWIIEFELPQEYKGNYSTDGSVIIETPQSKIVQVEVSIAGPQGPKGDPGNGLAILPRVSVNSSNIEVIDSIPITDFRSAKWMVNLSVDGRFKLFEVMALNNGLDVNHVSYAFVGDKVDFSLNVEKTLTDVVLTMSNMELTSLEVDVVRVGLIKI